MNSAAVPPVRRIDTTAVSVLQAQLDEFYEEVNEIAIATFDGIADVAFAQSDDDPREVHAVVTTESGRTYRRTVFIPCYRGDYEPGCAYILGDSTSYRDECWLCVSADAGTPGDGTGWTLRPVPTQLH